MADQQERPVSADFIAGIMVGEGTFTLAVIRRDDKIRIKPVFSLQMNDGRTMQRVHDSLKNLGIGVNMQHRANRGCWVIQCAGFKRMDTMLNLFLPLLTGTKQEAAKVVHDFIRSRANVSKFDAYTVDELNMVMRLRTINGVPGRKRTDINDLIGDTRNRQWKSRQESSETARLAS